MEFSEMPLDLLFKQLNKRADLLYRFIILYHKGMSLPKDYGTGDLINMVEVHTLTEIEEHPGCSVTDLAAKWYRSKSAVSQTVTKLEKKNLIEKKYADNNSKTILLFTTEQGRELSKCHKQYDIVDITQTLQELSGSCSTEEIDAFYKVIEKYLVLLERESVQEQ